MQGPEQWQTLLVCPVDHGALKLDGEDQWVCTSCHFRTQVVDIDGRARHDFRASGQPQQIEMTFTIPAVPLERDRVVRQCFQAIHQDFEHYSRREIRKRFGTKLDKGIQFYCQQLLHARGPEAMILDLGCGSGGNRRYLQTLGFNNVVTVDWNAKGADLLVDAHRLPFADGKFQMVLATAVFEHLYNPFIAISEISRVLDEDGLFVGGASFWEAWHGSSYFHLTPDGWNVLFHQAGLILKDLWPGWGIIPAAITHVIVPGHFRGLGYLAQGALAGVYRIVAGDAGLRRLQLRASGSYQVCAIKQSSSGNF